ncbi:FKBP-type peptidyl-prolyl cis-trans isomerase [Magnetofaba australis]|nr:FKBP-type peptidyl-prolyl cis-trans isomerase [Magnetofaba australis]
MSSAAQNEAAGKAFLQENAGKDGVESTATGLQYMVLEQGQGGPKPSAASQVTVHYTGSLLDGSVFDSSVTRGEPIAFGLNRVIPGWTEGVQLMSVGDKFRFFIPHELAYGPMGMPPVIPPAATLIFDVELLAIA